MKITAITQQRKLQNRYSVFVDEQYAFSLSDRLLLESKLHTGRVLTAQQIEAYKQSSQDDKFYNRALRYVAMRPRSVGEMTVYLERKGVDASLLTQILDKLQVLGLLDDQKFAEAYVHDRQLLRPTSRRKIIMELKKKYISDEIIGTVIAHDADNDSTALTELITRKRRQSKYQDDTKLMQYLARQGFSYNDIKHALGSDRKYLS